MVGDVLEILKYFYYIILTMICVHEVNVTISYIIIF